LPQWKKSLTQLFPESMSMDQLTKRVRLALVSREITSENTIFATSLCRDESVQRFSKHVGEYWQDHFGLGGIAGYPFGGKAGFGSFASHMPEDGNLFVLYGAHIGFDGSGRLGVSQRRGQSISSRCCGSLDAAFRKLAELDFEPKIELGDYEQSTIESALMPFREGIVQSDMPIKTITESMYQIIEERISEIVDSVDLNCRVVLLGGILINTPIAAGDYFSPKKATVLDYTSGELKESDWIRDIFEEITNIDSPISK
jgi:hypothetical protein